MPITFLAHNGTGLGHLARATVIAKAFSGIGEKPLIFAQGSGVSVIPHSFPLMAIPVIRCVSSSVQELVAHKIEQAALMSHPSLIIEDTLPSKLTFSSKVSRLLVVRPSDFSSLEEIYRKYSTSYDYFALTDQTDSPTWPYTLQQGREISTWQRWLFWGPVFRTPTTKEMEEVRLRHKITKRKRICVFTMGGGGEHEGTNDCASFINFSKEIAISLRKQDPTCRLLFVKGPYFRPGQFIPNIFEIIEKEPLMPALLSVAWGAVVRPGYNTVWECIVGHTPYLPLLGTSYREPINERLQNLRKHGLLVDDFLSAWNDEMRRSEFYRACENVKKCWPGQPADEALRSLLTGRKSSVTFPAVERVSSERSISLKPSTISTGRFHHLEHLLEQPDEDEGDTHRVENAVNHLKEIRCRKTISFRIDDVVELNEPLQWLLCALMRNQFKASLEVIPYLCKITERDLNDIDSKQNNFEISQHGYSHLERQQIISTKLKKGEFTVDVESPAESEIRELACGLEIIRNAFSTRFRGGFSPPYDGYAHWLAKVWGQLGGKFISTIWGKPHHVHIPVLTDLIEIWDWERNCRRSTGVIFDDIGRSLTRTGFAALVLHPQLFNTGQLRYWMEAVFATLADTAFHPALLSEIALEPSSRMFERV